ncbi:MAG: HupE/UreJ family protein [Shimia sp.]|uniref:HupE/UreJ family protein n=1 Tax=Shimia sp. TaxID=1954381 RepID=UPI001B2A2B6A|nr:HupE/UreJ family protein [Shimia sp.]MBO6899644.1 HupE/UreJ family protein [Shimia sp.]
MIRQTLKHMLWAPVLLVANPAYAHAPVPGLKGFYVGLLHPFSTPPQALMLLGLGLLIGSFATSKGLLFLVSFCTLSLLGVFTGSTAWALDSALLVMAITTCTLAALIPGRALPLGVLLSAVSGYLIGVMSIPDPGPLSDRLFTITGALFGANIGLLYLWGARNLIPARFAYAWVPLAFRITAAWLGAIALLMLALSAAGDRVS